MAGLYKIGLSKIPMVNKVPEFGPKILEKNFLECIFWISIGERGTPFIE